VREQRIFIAVIWYSIVIKSEYCVIEIILCSPNKTILFIWSTHKSQSSLSQPSRLSAVILSGIATSSDWTVQIVCVEPL